MAIDAETFGQYKQGLIRPVSNATITVANARMRLGSFHLLSFVSLRSEDYFAENLVSFLWFQILDGSAADITATGSWPVAGKLGEGCRNCELQLTWLG